MASASAASMTTMSSYESIPINQSHSNDQLEVLGQPCYASRLRYRKDFNTGKNRHAFLLSQNNPNYRCPTIRIPQRYLQFCQDSFYIRVSLVTISREQNNCRYVHPYELEDAHMHEFKDELNNAVWFPIEAGDKDGIKSFPNLRIVKKTENELKNSGDLRVFDSPNAPPTSQLSTPKETIREFSLNRLQLAFTVGQKKVSNGKETYIAYAVTTVFSDEVVRLINIKSHQPKPSIEQIYQYLPEKGQSTGNDRVIVIFTNKLKFKRQETLEISFEYHADSFHWSETVRSFEVQDRFVTFRSPPFPYLINTPVTAQIVLKQKQRQFDPLQFVYLPTNFCSRCQQSIDIVPSTNPTVPPISVVHQEVNIQNENPMETDVQTSLTPLFPGLFSELDD